MKKKQFRIMVILWLICAVILQNVPASAQNEEIGLKGSSSSFYPPASIFELRNMDEWRKVIEVEVNKEKYQKASDKSELKQAKKYWLPDAGYLEPKIYLSKLEKGDEVKFITAKGYLKLKIANPSAWGNIHDKSSVKYVVKQEDPKPEEPQKPEKREISLKVLTGFDYIIEISPAPQKDEIKALAVDYTTYQAGTSKYAPWGNAQSYFLDGSRIYLM